MGIHRFLIRRGKVLGSIAGKKKNILYTPDFIINAGGLIDVSEEYLGYKTGYKEERVKRKTENIYDRVLAILRDADEKDISTKSSHHH